MHFKKITIIGMGLIGGSIGKAVIERGLADEVVGVCRRQVSLDKAIAEKSLTHGFLNDHAEAVKGADLVIIATPVHTIKNMLSTLAEVIADKKVIVTDVGSTKEEIVKYAVSFKDKFTFIGAHPLAGSEKAGVQFSETGLFEKSVCILTPEESVGEEHVSKLKSFWEAVGAKVLILTSREHDRNLAFSSHLPHVIAYALAGTLEEGVPHDMYATGFGSTARIAASDPELWKDIFLSNRDNVLASLKVYESIIADIRSAIADEDEAKLKELLGKYKGLIDELS